MDDRRADFLRAIREQPLDGAASMNNSRSIADDITTVRGNTNQAMNIARPDDLLVHFGWYICFTCSCDFKTVVQSKSID